MMMSLQIGNLNIVRLSWKLQLDFEIEFSIISSWSSVGLLFVGANSLELDKTKRIERIKAKTQQLQDLILQVVSHIECNFNVIR